MIKLFQGNCLEQMKNISDKSIDLILCDLPYELQTANGTRLFRLSRYGKNINVF